MNLVIVESPTKALMLSKFLGSDYRVEATMGHIRDLPAKKFGVEIIKGDHSVTINPQYEVVAEKKARIKKLQQGARDSASIILATDPDREGEAIAWHSAVLLDDEGTKDEGQRPKEVKRVVFHQITKDAIIEAMKHPRELDMRLVDAQQARRVLDRVVGYKLSPLLWKKIRRGLSAGRVQSVTVRLIVDREREIEAFVPVEFWEVLVDVSPAFAHRAAAGKQVSTIFTVKLVEIEGKKAELGKKEQVEPIVADLETATYKVAEVEKKEVRRHPYPPFTTSTLQQMGASVLRWSGKKTMSVAQQLYEHGYISYHRTDSFHLAPLAITAARNYIASQMGEPYLPSKPNFYKTKSALAQEAHEAIRVTNVADIHQLSKIESDLTRMARDGAKLYEQIWKRFIACQMADQIYDQTTIKVIASSRRHYGLRAQGQVEKFDGWRRIYQVKSEKLKVESSAADEQVLPDVVRDEKLELIKVDPQQKFTLPPARYTEAMLVRQLEARGIGRPSTYAPIISTIQDRGYVEKAEGRFKPTPVGLTVNDFLVQYFSEIVDPDFTRNLEENLDHIAQGKRQWQEVIGSFWSPFTDQLDKVTQVAKRQPVPVEETGQMCPECQEGRQIIRSGRFGKFLACSRFPECKWTGKLIEKLDMKCPDCGRGDVVIKKTRQGKRFYGCSRYPECKWAGWRKPG